MFADDAGHIPASTVEIEEASYSMGGLLTIIGVRDGALHGVTYTLGIAQGLGREAVEDLDKHIIYEPVQCVPLVGASYI